MAKRYTPNPHRVFALAVNSTRLLGILSTGFGLYMLIAYGFLNRLQRFQVPFELFAAIVWLLPGVDFLTASILIKQRRWMIIFALCVAAFQLLAAGGLFICSCVLSPVSAIPIIMCGAWVAALIQLIYYLWQSLNLWRFIDANIHHGFEPIMPATPLPDNDQPSVSVRGK